MVLCNISQHNKEKLLCVYGRQPLKQSRRIAAEGFTREISNIKIKERRAVIRLQIGAREQNKTISRIVGKLGLIASLLPESGNDRERIIAWAKEEAAAMTEEENASATEMALEVSESR